MENLEFPSKATTRPNVVVSTTCLPSKVIDNPGAPGRDVIGGV